MLDPAQSAVTALTGSTTETVGRFRYDVPTDTWWWSPSLYTIHGFNPGEIVPTTALMTAHQHPEDQAATAELVTASIRAGKPFCSRHRILDAHRRVHTVVTIGEGIRDTNEHVTQVRGYLIDVTDALHRDLAAATQLAVSQSAETRAEIDQAKGALMITYGIDGDEAFAVLRWHSQHHNIKLRDIATTILNRTTDPALAQLPAAEKISLILSDLPTGESTNATTATAAAHLTSRDARSALDCVAGHPEMTATPGPTISSARVVARLSVTRTRR